MKHTQERISIDTGWIIKMKKEDLTNKKFGEWVVLNYAGNKKWVCRCSCGTVKEVATYSLTSGTSTSCGHKSKKDEPKETKQVKNSKEYSIEDRQRIFGLENLTNKRFGDWEVLRYTGNSFWECRCSCGKVSNIFAYQLTSGRSKSCGHNSNRFKDITGKRFGDWEPIEYLGRSRWKCKCVCGYTKDFRAYDLINKSKYNYVCKHAAIINRQYGKLTVIERLDQKNCLCKCSCGKDVIVLLSNLLNGSTNSCGCIKAPTYTKDEIIEAINMFTAKNGDRPFAEDLSSVLGLSMTATYENINNYGLKYLLNKEYGSRLEMEVASKFNNIELHNRKLIPNYELDMYIPEKKLAIEINGNFWHCSMRKEKTYHQKKTLLCAKNGIRLVHIFEYELKNNLIRPKILKFISRLSNKDSNIKQVYARNLNIKELSDTRVVREFLDKYHLQGYTSSSINIALCDDEEDIQAIMTFGKPRFDTGYELELIRLCYKDNIAIVGGAEKMFNYIITHYHPANIVTYCDISKFTGNVYTRLGFNVVKNGITSPNYVWVSADSQTVLSRYQTQKSKLIEMGIADETDTEDSIMYGIGYYKLYNSGNLKLEYIENKQKNL